jgi:PAS domain S-box-containing protein
MSPVSRVLAIEDSQADFLLVQRNLKQHGLDAAMRRVDTYEGLAQALQEGPWDAVLSDYALPGMDFRTTLDLINRRAPGLPVILLSGHLDEEEAVELLQKGLSDFVSKERPARLAGALAQAVEAARVREARRLAEKARMESEARLSLIFRSSPVGILLGRVSDERIIDANPSFLALTGYGLEELLGRTTAQVGLWADPRQRAQALEQVRETGQVQPLEAEFLTRSGARLSLLWSAERVELGGEGMFVAMVLDQTERRRAEEERKRLEAEVAHAQKLESLGALAGGVAHDMNNVLAAVMSLASVLKDQRPGDPLIAKAMDTFLHADGRGRDLVKGLTDFVRKDIPEPRPLDLNEVVRKEAALLTRTTLQKVEVELSLEEGAPQVMGDPGSIANALMNLCVNALDAMPRGGRLTLATRLGPGGMLELAVKDTGGGMPPEVVQRALEPFFTTKPAGKGTGLGLSLVYGIMKAHGGRVEIRSQPGQGTEIILSFPRHQVDPQASAGPLPGAGPDQSSRRILLVDDDDMIRATLPLLLESLGHQVAAMPDGPQALQSVQAGFIPEVVITDLSMPGMDGEEFIQRLRFLLPTVPVIMATGYQDQRSERILERFDRVWILTKPFTMLEMKQHLGLI